MNVGKHNTETPKTRFQELRKELIENASNKSRQRLEGLSELDEERAATRAARGADQPVRAEGHREDRIEISSRAEELAREEQRTREAAQAEERAAHVAELKRRHDAGELHTPEALERAAERLLTSEDRV